MIESRTIGVFYALGAAGPLDVVAAAGGDVRPLFLYEGDDAHAAALFAALDDLVHAVDVSQLDDAGVAELLAGEGAAGVTTFADAGIVRCAAAAAALGLPYHDAATALALTRKDVQRELLNRAGVGDLRHAAVSSASELPEAVARVGLPAVVKPAIGSASRSTSFLADAADAERVREEIALTGRLWQVEEYIPGIAHPGDERLADYVSVESLSLPEGSRWHFCVTDRLPTVPPFRETAALVPSVLPEDVTADVKGTADDALDALGVRHGLTHTELKLTEEGPRVIEVNGRLGGPIHRLVGRVTALNPVRLAIAAALGEAHPGDALSFDGHAMYALVQAPPGRLRVTRTVEQRALRALDGVWAAEEHVSVGEQVDSGHGSLSCVQTVWLEAPSFDELLRDYAAVARLVAERNVFEPV